MSDDDRGLRYYLTHPFALGATAAAAVGGGADVLAGLVDVVGGLASAVFPFMSVLTTLTNGFAILPAGLIEQGFYAIAAVYAAYLGLQLVEKLFGWVVPALRRN